ncbi:hypothetical protein IFR04_006116 [Cadophora malorum]|uniref:Major facilitator superfamily (MFS) profile domain-containing protein n=1 Tax=Cadophora malorum TaxID=108018 RepID=A0A8H7W855_9HELO|nr:hypothetical protein IFR04_006116 [Cadophora malorum]
MDSSKEFEPEPGTHQENVLKEQSSFEQDNHVDRVPTVPLYEDGKVNLIPMPTDDPNDPLNLPKWRTWAAIGSICLFGAMAAAAELILGAMLPVFVIQYSPIGQYPPSYKILQHIHLPEDVNSLRALEDLNQNAGPPIWKTFLLASLPILMIGLSNFLFVPLAITFGRRPVVLVSGIIAIGGAVWAGHSTSLDSHLGARAIQAIGAGTVESLIPFIISDMVFLHQRNKAISLVFGIQGLLIVILGIATPWIIIRVNWNWIYFITAIAAGVFWIACFFFMPETRYYRTDNEMKGISRHHLLPGQSRPPIDLTEHAPRSWKRDLMPWGGPIHFRRGLMAFVHTLQTFFYPHIFFVTLLNSATIAATLAAGYTVSPQLLAEPWAWPFEHLGFLLFAVLISAIAVFLISGLLADSLANLIAKRRGRRDPEIQALNLIPPTVISLIGTILFGLAGDEPGKYGWPTFLVGLGFISYGFLATNSIGVVYVLECYPHMSGPALVNIGSFRSIIAFLIVFDVPEWIASMGYLRTFGIYMGLLGGFILFIPIIFMFGEGWRKRWPGPTERVDVNVVKE